ncbi:DUF6263 family protein [Phycisphaerales bacterium AB-hyl4]|uniref:DUF6263 family protein n=1 Tax=Natronomicrosphaera hydrolytica TaxID=3242702 RepID=A0ABV4U1H8_9BACT
MTFRIHPLRRSPAWLALLAMPALLLMAMPAIAPAQDAPAAIDLRPDWQVGQTARYEIWSHRQRRTTMSMGGESHEVNVTMVTEGEVTWTVDRVNDDGSATCTMVLDWLSMTVTDNEGGQQIIDSRRGSGDVPAMHQALQAMAGQPVRFEIASDGSVDSVAGVNTIRQRTEAEPMAPEDRDFVRSATELALLIAAPDNANPGQTWQTRHAWSHEAGTMHYNIRHTLNDVGEVEGIPVATVYSEAQLELEVDDADMPPDAPPIDIRMTQGSRQGQVIFDLQRREAVGRNSLEQTTIEVTVRMPEQTLRQRIDETIQGQALRISEE